MAGYVIPYNGLATTKPVWFYSGYKTMIFH